MHDAMWVKVDELIHKFELGHDDEATMEHLAEEHEDDL
jgi:low affinity Fe/Cu permease